VSIKDKNGKEIREGDSIRYYDSYQMWIESIVIDVGSALAVETSENPILLYEFARGHTDDRYVYDGTPIPELEVLP
jgi:hypothetical protein